VLTTTIGANASCSSCGLTLCPPCSSATVRPVPNRSRRASNATCAASSRVGTST